MKKAQLNKSETTLQPFVRFYEEFKQNQKIKCGLVACTHYYVKLYAYAIYSIIKMVKRVVASEPFSENYLLIFTQHSIFVNFKM